DDIAAEAGITRVILYRHFDSKTDRNRAVLDRACTRLAETVGTGNYGEDAIATLVRAAATHPDAFRLLFPHAARSQSSATRPARCPPPMGYPAQTSQPVPRGIQARRQAYSSCPPRHRTGCCERRCYGQQVGSPATPSRSVRSRSGAPLALRDDRWPWPSRE